MTRHLRSALLISVLTFAGAPALALAHGTPHKGAATGHNAAPPAHAKAYGYYCRNESKTHVAGQKGTPFSKCVRDLAKLHHGEAKSPGQACRNESRKHVEGMKGTPFSQCVVAAAHMQKDEQSS